MSRTPLVSGNFSCTFVWCAVYTNLTSIWPKRTETTRYSAVVSMCTACFHIYRAMYVLVLTKYHSLCCLNADVTVVVATNGRCHSAGEMDRTGSCSAGQHSTLCTAARHAVHFSDCQSDISLAAAVTELTSIAVHLQCGVSAVCLQCSAVCLRLQETNKYQQLTVT
jgi:hypothetical protein